jgi:predicted DNA-binding transcriptional regulator AlpA
MKKWIEWLEKQDGPIKADQIAKILGVTPAQVYKLAAEGKIPGTIRVSDGAIRFCPDIFADWLRSMISAGGSSRNAPKQTAENDGSGTQKKREDNNDIQMSK